MPTASRRGSSASSASDPRAGLTAPTTRRSSRDDNVHLQHSEPLFDELVKHGTLFEYLAYPNRTHSIVERAGTRKHLYGSLSDFLNRRVPPGPKLNPCKKRPDAAISCRLSHAPFHYWTWHSS